MSLYFLNKIAVYMLIHVDLLFPMSAQMIYIKHHIIFSTY